MGRCVERECDTVLSVELITKGWVGGCILVYCVLIVYIETMSVFLLPLQVDLPNNLKCI